MPTPIDPVLFRETLGHYPTGVAVVTATGADGNPLGMVVGTFSSVSMDPPLIGFFPMKNSRSFAQIRTSMSFCINVLASDQEPLCRKLAAGGPDKFTEVGWRPAPLGSPILEGAVSWVECTFEDVREAGDHYIVLGRVKDFGIERPGLPLLFFQGGYGRFSPRSLAATPDPELIQAAQLAEKFRSQVEDFSSQYSANCSVLVKIGWDAVQVLTSNQELVAEPLGHRQPIIPPLGAAFLVDSPPAEVDEWLARAKDDDQVLREFNLNLLDKVRAHGYSVLAAKPEPLRRHQEALSAFELSDRLPRQERVVKNATSELAELFCPDLEPDELYDIASIVAVIPTAEGLPTMALRMTGLPGAASTEKIEAWGRALRQAATEASHLTALQH